MLKLTPRARLISTFLLVFAALLAEQTTTLCLVYVVVAGAIVASVSGAAHLRFVVVVTLPLLFALLFVWGWVADSAQIPTPHKTGVSYALYVWLRIVTCGGAFQFLFVPLLKSPTHLRDFIGRSGIPRSLGTSFLAAIVFLPEIRRRFDRIVDARKAQGYSAGGLDGLVSIPSILMPLVSSLLDSAVKRGELWSHRGILSRSRYHDGNPSYSAPQSLAVLVVSSSAVAVVLVS